jgi:uncharacterized protein (TIGR02453 family)
VKKISATHPPFAGFPRQAFGFLRKLKQNNDREWFAEHKGDYIRLVHEPMTHLVLGVAEGCRTRGLNLHAKEKSPVMRVYRDIRFSKDKSPFKTHVGAEIRRSFTDSECLLYMHVSPGESFVAAGVWQASKNLLQAWRQKIIQDPARFGKVRRGLDRAGLAITTEYALSGMPRGYQMHAGGPIAAWLKLTSFVVRRDLTIEQCLKPDLVDRIVDFAIAVRPLFEYAWEVEAARTSMSVDPLHQKETFAL